MTVINVNLPPLHRNQAAIQRCNARFIVVVAGRRFGKTRLGVLMTVERALAGKWCWWVAPSYPDSKIGWKMLTVIANQIPGVNMNRVDRLVTFPGGGWVQIRSAHEPDALRSEGLDYVVLDEAAYIRVEAWESVRPALSDRQGGALFISTPRSRNWFYDLYMRGRNEQYPDWQSFHFVSTDNPFMRQSEVDIARTELPQRVFEREYLAQFVDDRGQVFRFIQQAAVAPKHPAPSDHAGHDFVIGVDWGKYEDFTAFSLGCRTCMQQLEIDRFNQIDYRVQVQRLEAMIARWGIRDNVTLYVERNAMGDPLVEQLQHSGLNVIPFTTTATSKPRLIESLALAFERGEITILHDDTQLDELANYTVTLNRVTGRATYSAPVGAHDDTVMALALMLFGMVSAGVLVG